MTRNLIDFSDEELLLQIEQDSGLAFDALYERYWEKAFSEAYKRLKNTDQAKDVVQDVFTDIWQRRETLQIANFPAYLHVAVRNRVFKFFEKQKHSHPFFDLIENLPSLCNMADANILVKELADSYRSLVDALPPQRRLIFKLRFQEDLTTKDIADTLRLSRKTVQNQLSKAIEHLKVSLSHRFLIILIFIISKGN